MQNYKLNEWVSVWLYTYKRIMVKPSTFDSYCMYATHVTCDKLLQELTNFDVQRMINDMVVCGRQLSTIKHMLVIVRQALKKARALGLIDSLSCLDGLELPKISPKKISGLSEAQTAAILNSSARSYYSDFFKSLLLSGMRVGELIALRWCDVDLFSGTIRIMNTDYMGQLQPCKSDTGQRTIPLYGDLLRIFKRQYRKKPVKSSQRVFLNTLGNPIKYHSLLDRWHAYLNDIGIYECMGMHVLRHTFAHRALRSGIPVKVVSAWLGHADISITLAIYDHVDALDMKKAADTLAAAF